MTIKRALLHVSVLLTCAVCQAQDVTHVMDFGGAVVEGSFLSTLKLPTDGTQLMDSADARGSELRFGWLALVGQEEGVFRFGTGVQFRHRIYFHHLLSTSSGGSVSSFYREEHVYDGEVRTGEWNLGVPVQLWWHLGTRSRITFGGELQLALPKRGWETGTLTTTTTHYIPPTQVPGSVDVAVEGYGRYVEGSVIMVARVQWSVGYRHQFTKGFMLGVDVSLIHALFRSDRDPDPVRSLGMVCSWIIPNAQESHGSVP